MHEHIADFGGDSAQITVGGQSAGGIAGGNLLAMPSARGLFHRALLMAAPARG